MAELHDRLVELAAVADDAPVRDTARLARERARRFARRRRVGTAALLTTCAVMILTLAGVSWSKAADPAPADTDARHALPDRLYEPSRWLPGTASAGPLGSLAAAVDAERGSWTGTHPGVVGISATTGDYRFLDLPDAALNQAWALSPDGRHVAYWTTGETKASPNQDSGPVTGVAVYDTATGKTTRHTVETEHGLSPDILAWAGSRQLIFGYGQWLGGRGDPLMAQDSAASGPRLAWTLGTVPRRLPLRKGAEIEAVGLGHILVWDDNASGSVFTEVNLNTGHEVARVDLGDDTSKPPVLDNTGKMVAVVAGLTADPRMSGKNPNMVRAGTVAGPVPRIPHSGRTFDVVGWVDPHHLAVHQRTGSLNNPTLPTAINLLDTRNGAKHRIM